jgi:acetyl esterase
MSLLMPSRVPVWMWKALMAQTGPREERLFNAQPIDTVDYAIDIDYLGDGRSSHRLDVITPRATTPGAGLPVYVYFHGGGWTSGDKKPLTKYAASQALGGMVVVNANYRLAGKFQMKHMLQDANSVLGWVRSHIEAYGGDPLRIIVGGDSAGGQIASLVTSATTTPELANHYDFEPAIDRSSIRGLVQHCTFADFNIVFERGFIMSLDFVRMLLPNNGRGAPLDEAARYLSPIEWVNEQHPPTLITSSVRDFLYRANTNFAARLRSVNVPVETLFLGKEARNARHTWQQNALYPESQAVYSKLHSFVDRVASPLVLPA